MGFVVDKVALGQVFSENFSFLPPVIIGSLLHTHLRTGAGVLGPLKAMVPRNSPEKKKEGKTIAITKLTESVI
jgi:hypothetical protein